jgi:DNA-binding transcriptional regulator YhcF (GntR family)
MQRSNPSSATGVPFAWSRDGRATLTESLYRAVDRAIAEGKYREGDVLPPRGLLARHLGVSEHVVRAALSRLQAEGKVVARPRLGVRVLPQGAKRTSRGTVLMVRHEGLRGSYSWGVTDAVLRQTFEDSGLRYETAFVSRSARGRMDALAKALDLAPEVVIYRADTLRTADAERLIGRSGRPYVYSGFGTPRFANCVGRYFEDFSSARADFLSACAKSRVMSVCQIGFGPDRILDMMPDFLRCGASAERIDVGTQRDFGDLESVQRAAMDAMNRRLRSGHLPELLFFTDDYVATGALTALLERGVRIPRDVKVATIANRGFGPVFPKHLSRIEFDAAESAHILAANVVAWSETGRYPDSAVYSPRYVVGETFF